jgi:hypothetical protein
MSKLGEMKSSRQNDGRSGYRRAVLVLAVCFCVLAASAAAACAAPAPSAKRLFSPNSVWNRPLPRDAAIDPSSREMVAGLVQEVQREQSAGIGPWIQTDSYSTPLYVVGPNQPRVRVQLSDPTASWRKTLQTAFTRVPIPTYAQPAAGSDGHMTVWQPSTDTMWEFWQASKQSDGWHASWGGAIRHVSQSPGYYTKNSWPGLSEPNWGATATSLPVIAGTMLVRDLRSPWIRHALALDLPAPRAGEYAWPAQRTDGHGPPGSIPEGARLRIRPGVNLRAMHLPRITLMMARAAKRRGMIVRDQTGTAIGFFAQDPAGYKTDPYYGPGGVFGGQYPNKFLARFPWNKVVVLKMSLCSDQSRACLRHKPS